MPGDLAPFGIAAPWSFHLGLASRPTQPRVVLFGNAFRVQFDWDGKPHFAQAIVVEPGILLGQTDAALMPSLFSAEHDVQHGTGLQWLSSNGTSIALATAHRDGKLRFCLAAGPWEHIAAVHLARSRLDRDPGAVFEEEYARRSRLFETLDTPPEAEAATSAAVEGLVARLRPAIGPFTHRWCSTGAPGDDRFDLNLLLALTSAWGIIDGEVAEDLLRTVFSLQAPNGSLPASVDAEGEADFSRAPWPFVAQSVALLADAGDRPDLAAHAVPHLRRYLRWVLDRFDPDRAGLPAWAQPEEAIVDAVFDPDMFSVDLAALLLAEIDAWKRVLRAAGMSDAGEFDQERSRLVRSLETKFWNPEAGVFQDCFEDGSYVERATLGAILPLLWPELQDLHRTAVTRQLQKPGLLMKPNGVALWAQWEGDPQPPPVRASDQVLVLRALRVARAAAASDRFASVLRKTLVASFAATNRLDLETPSTPSPTGGGACAVPDTATAALAVMLAAADQPGEAETASGFRAWANRHGRGIIAAAVAIPACIAVAIVISFLGKKTPPMSSLEAMVGLAKHYYTEGRYDEAIEIYEGLVVKRQSSAPLEIYLGNAYFQKGDLAAAKQWYMRALGKKQSTTAATMNLALALFREGNLDESAAYYNRILQEQGARPSEYTARARVALDLIRERNSFRRPPGYPASNSL